MKKKIIILGAGISGLTLAWYLEKRFSSDLVEITILEPEKRVGGWIASCNVDGFFFECGPRSLRWGKDRTLFRELGLEGDIIEADSQSNAKYLVFQGKVTRVPENPLAIVTSPLGRKCFRAVMSYPFRRKPKLDDETVAHYFGARFGRDFVDTVIDPMVAGIWAADPDKISYRATLATMSLRKMDLLSFTRGLELLPKRLVEQLDATICTGTKLEHIQLKEKSCEVAYDGRKLEADHLFSTLSPDKLKPLLSDETLAALVPPVPRVSLAIVVMGFHEALLRHKGFGCLAPSKEEHDLLGISFDSAIFPHLNGLFQTRLSVMLGGQRAPECAQESESELRQKALYFCKKYLHIDRVPHVMEVIRAERSISAYPVGHLARMARLEERLSKERLTLLGAGLYGISVPACITHAQELASKFDINF
jgi:oxygen-dependent protoporphyrinogen oxidase